MKCPHCKKQLKISDTHIINMESYHTPVLSKTECCGKALSLYPEFSFKAYKYEGDRKTDDWGDRFITTKQQTQ